MRAMSANQPVIGYGAHKLRPNMIARYVCDYSRSEVY